VRDESYGPPVSGVIVVDKPPGITSRRAVDRVKRAFGVRKAGHAGTLDPDATGVLIVCLGRATKLFRYLTEGEKEYIGTITLGVETDTQDASGRVIKESEVNVTEEQVKEVAFGFVGEITQIPPMYSAIRVNGRRLYKLARRGQEVERPPRKVTIYELEISRIELPEIDFRVVCSKGTYIRTLASDIGKRLSCGAHLSRLRRIRSGPFTLEMALPLEKIESDPQLAYQYLLSIEEVLEILRSGCDR
jgi:tRNA pseudouridine55 synthase